MTPHQQRRCVSCGRREHKRSLLRLKVRDGKLFWDREGSSKGRSAYCHRLEKCVAGLNRKGLLAKALRLKEAQIALEDRESLVCELRAELMKEDVQ